MSMVFLEKHKNVLIAIPIEKIDWIQWDNEANILSIQTGKIIHKMFIDAFSQGKQVYERIIKQIEDFYNNKGK